MKAKLNLTIEQELLLKAKQYAAQHKTSISTLVEDYLKNISKPKKAMSFVEMIDSLPKPSKNKYKDVDFKKDYYEAKAKKYGF